MIVSNIYVPKDNKRSATYAYNVREGDIVTVKRYSTREEAELRREADRLAIDLSGVRASR